MRIECVLDPAHHSECGRILVALQLIELELADGTSDDEIADMCRRLLANTVIENFKIERMAPRETSGQAA